MQRVIHHRHPLIFYRRACQTLGLGVIDDGSLVEQFPRGIKLPQDDIIPLQAFASMAGEDPDRPGQQGCVGGRPQVFLTMLKG